MKNLATTMDFPKPITNSQDTVNKGSDLFSVRVSTTRGGNGLVMAENLSTFRGNTPIPFQDTRNVESYFRKTAIGSRGVVQFLNNSSLPVVWGSDGDPVFLYQIVEELDAVTDYGELQARLPTLSIGQIVGSIGYLRKLSQFNTVGIDIDKLENQELESSSAFQAAVLKSMEDKQTRVLSVD